MKAAHQHYGEHQKSEMALPKMHALMHVADDIAEGGALAHYRADAYESSHKNIKTAFNSGSRRGDAGHEEALGVMERADFLRMSSGRTDRGARIDVVSRLSRPPDRVRGARTKTKAEAVTSDTFVLTRGPRMIRAQVILNFLAKYRGGSGLGVTTSNLPVSVRQLVADLGGPRDFVWFMEKLNLGPEDTLSRSNSAYGPGHPFPVAEKTVDNRKMLISVVSPGEGDAANEKVERDVQRVVATHRFHGSTHAVQNFVAVEAESPETTRKRLHSSVRERYATSVVRSVWIAKVLAMFTVRRRVEGAIGVVPGSSTVSEVTMVQYLDLCQKEPDDVDKALGCARLRWAQEEDCDDMRTGFDKQRRYFDVLPVETIRGLVHVVRGDYGLGVSRTYSCEGDRHWTKVWFYLNRFKLERRGAKLFMDENE